MEMLNLIVYIAIVIFGFLFILAIGSLFILPYNKYGNTNLFLEQSIKRARRKAYRVNNR